MKLIAITIGLAAVSSLAFGGEPAATGLNSRLIGPVRTTADTEPPDGSQGDGEER